MQVESVLGGIRNDWEVRAVMCAFAGLMEVTCERFVTDVLSRRLKRGHRSGGHESSSDMAGVVRSAFTCFLPASITSAT